MQVLHFYNQPRTSLVDVRTNASPYCGPIKVGGDPGAVHRQVRVFFKKLVHLTEISLDGVRAWTVLWDEEQLGSLPADLLLNLVDLVRREPLGFSSLIRLAAMVGGARHSRRCHEDQTVAY